jgi:hypothetical protein
MTSRERNTRLARHHRNEASLCTEPDIRRAHELAALRYEVMVEMNGGVRLAKGGVVEEEKEAIRG